MALYNEDYQQTGKGTGGFGMKRIIVSIREKDYEWLKQQVKDGRFNSIGQAIRCAIYEFRSNPPKKIKFIVINETERRGEKIRIEE